jgi:hypothetical protein
MGEKMSRTTTIAVPPVDGLKLLKILNFDHRLAGSIIAQDDTNWKELLRTITPEQLQRNVASVVWQVRECLGKDFDYAREISSSGLS